MGKYERIKNHKQPHDGVKKTPIYVCTILTNIFFYVFLSLKYKLLRGRSFAYIIEPHWFYH